MLCGRLGYTQRESNAALQTILFRRNRYGKHLPNLAWRPDVLC